MGISAQADVMDRVAISSLTTPQGRTISFGDQFFKGSDLASVDPITNLIMYSFPSAAVTANEMVYIGRAHYTLNADASVINRTFFQDIQTFAYLLGPSSRLELKSSNPYRLACSKFVTLGISIESEQVIQVFESKELRADPVRAALVQQLNTHPTLPTRVVLQSFSNFSDYFSLGVMLTMIYPDRPGQTSVDVVSVSLIHSVPLLIGRSFIRSTSKDDLFYYVDHLAYLERH